jgi:hypothetical protein
MTRLKTDSRPCQHCGGVGRRTRLLSVEPVRPYVPDVSKLALCASCVQGEDRTWRLRYRLADEVAA